MRQLFLFIRNQIFKDEFVSYHFTHIILNIALCFWAWLKARFRQKRVQGNDVYIHQNLGQ